MSSHTMYLSMTYLLYKTSTLKQLYFTQSEPTPYILEQKFIVGNQVYIQKMHISLGFLYTIFLSTTGARSCYKDVLHKLTLTRDLNGEYHVFRHTFSPPSSAPCSRNISCSVSDTFACGQSRPGDNLFNQDYSFSEPCCEKPLQCSVSIESKMSIVEESSYRMRNPCERTLRGDTCPHTSQCIATKEPLACSNCTASFPPPLANTHSIRVATYNMWNLNSFEWESYNERLNRLGKVWWKHAISNRNSYLLTKVSFLVHVNPKHKVCV